MIATLSSGSVEYPVGVAASPDSELVYVTDKFTDPMMAITTPLGHVTASGVCALAKMAAWEAAAGQGPAPLYSPLPECATRFAALWVRGARFRWVLALLLETGRFAGAASR